ncbi:MAG: hypothetical protein V4478_02845 [Patescibacteria group bacterium]
MDDFYIKIGNERIRIDKTIFVTLLDLSPIKQYVSYKDAVLANEISLVKLKDLAAKANVPYPLFFAKKEKVIKQLKDKEKNLFDKLPTKTEAQVGARGNMKTSDIELIVKDLARKQEFLKTRILQTEPDNAFIGHIAKMVKTGVSDVKVAEKVREYFEIDLAELRGLSKAKVIGYLCGKAENKNILVSISSYNFMPQNIQREVQVSGICVKDKKFPFIFINTRDGDEEPLILESEGRQIFSIISMMVCIGMNKFILNMKSGKTKDESLKKVYALTAEILIPAADLNGVKINNIDDLKQQAQFFKVTPSMLLVRLKELRLISKPVADACRDKLINEIKNAQSSPKHQPSLVNGYGKYNGHKFSQEVVRAYASGKISHDEVKNVLFRKGKMDTLLFQQYYNQFK